MTPFVSGSEEGGRRAERSAGQRAYDWIRDAIIRGVYVEGQFIDEVALSHQVGTSRTPVREAFQRLQAERFIDLVPRRGAQVRVLTVTEMRELYKARFLLESESLRDICRRRLGCPADAVALLQTMDDAGRERDWTRFAQLDQAFHSRLVHHQGNAVIAELYDSIQPRQIRLGTRTLVEGPERLKTIEEEHRQLTVALEQHDADRCIELLAQHLQEIPKLVHAFATESDDDADPQMDRPSTWA